MKTPTSGLSLFIHLIIIAVATLFGMLLGERGRRSLAQAFRVGSTPAQRRALLHIASLAIIVFFAVFMVIATGVAIQTGVREGARESHVIFVKTELQSLWANIDPAIYNVPFAFYQDAFHEIAARKTTYVREDK